MKIACISCHDYPQYSIGYHDEESQLLAFLLNKGLDIERREWNDTTTNWTHYDVAILKTPWDYHEHIEDFYTWLETIQTLKVKLLNPVEMIRWNSDKHYLQDISNAGLRIIPPIFLERNTTPGLQPVFDKLQANKIILKPCVSAGAKNVLTLTRDDINTQQATVYQLLLDESYIAQPFMDEIFEGEWSYIFFGGRFSHCILNVPGGGDFRVQHYHGGSTRAIVPEQSQIESAAAYVGQFAKGALYARVDGLVRNGQFHLMELELIEPYLYLNTNAYACENFYNALLQLVSDRIQIQ